MSARKLGVAGALCALLLMCLPALAQTNDVLQKDKATPQALLEALTPAPAAAAPTPEDGTAPVAKTRSFKVIKSGASHQSAPAKPASASLMITFETQSSKLTEESKRVLANLAIALNAASLSKFHFSIEGHADRRGSSEKNLALSQERAEAVRQHLVTNFQIDPARLTAVGKGDSEQLNLENPAAPENRRVRIITLSE